VGDVQHSPNGDDNSPKQQAEGEPTNRECSGNKSDSGLDDFFLSPLGYQASAVHKQYPTSTPNPVTALVSGEDANMAIFSLPGIVQEEATNTPFKQHPMVDEPANKKRSGKKEDDSGMESMVG